MKLHTFFCKLFFFAIPTSHFWRERLLSTSIMPRAESSGGHILLSFQNLAKSSLNRTVITHRPAPYKSQLTGSTMCANTSYLNFVPSCVQYNTNSSYSKYPDYSKCSYDVFIRTIRSNNNDTGTVLQRSSSSVKVHSVKLWGQPICTEQMFIISSVGH